jgi:transposase InsO family protein
MAQNHTANGMMINLSEIPPKCTHCILGKQTHLPLPNTREGPKVSKCLEHIHVDLNGPQPVQSRSGRQYSMNIIDDHSSYIWSTPLRLKSEAVSILQAWQRTVENQTNEQLKILVTDNGELVSDEITTWCSSHGIVHQMTAPYTSLQNGHAEHLHRTVMNKARSMRLVYGAPPSFWDEFCATSAYLTNFTSSTTLNKRMPFEIWYGYRPSISHLWEIGCQAFTLNLPRQPKILQCSRLCILIGYTPNVKAYRL